MKDVTRTGIIAPKRNFAPGATAEGLAFAAQAWNQCAFRLALQQLYVFCLDHRIECEGASAFALAPAAVTAMNKQGPGS
jgi:hypothetical protein